MDGSDVLLKVEGEDHRIPLEAISKAKLVLTDALIEAVTQDADQDSVASDNDNDIQDES
jgi:hypothetical protein